MKKLILFLLLLSPSTVWSLEVKLSCSINTVTEYSTGGSERGQFNQIFVVTDLGNYRSIISNSDDFASVSTKGIKSTVSVDDLSDSNIWDITNNNKLPNGSTMTTSIRIDRNVGKIWYSSSFDNNQITRLRTGSGDCEKVNVSKKKF